MRSQEVDKEFSNMDRLPHNFLEEALQEPTNDLIQPTVIHPLEEVTEVVPAPVPVDPPNPQQLRDEFDSIMAQADDLQMYRDFEEYIYNGYYSDTDAPEDSDAEYSDAD